MADARLAAEGEPVRVGASEEHRLRAERKRLDDVGARADAAVEQHGEPVADRRDDVGEGVERGDRAVHLTAAVVRDDDAVDARLGREPCVVGVLDALQHDRPAPVVAEEGQVVPRERVVAERRRPVQDRPCPVVVADCAPEDRVGEVVLVALATEERQERAVEVARPPAHAGRVERDDEGLVPRRGGPCEKARHDVAILRPVELEPARRVPARVRDLLEGRRGGGAHDERQAEGRRGPRDRGLRVGMGDREHPDGREQDRRGERGAEDGHAQVRDGRPRQHPRHDPPRVERRPVGADGRLRPRAARDVAERGGRHRGLGERLEPGQVGRQVGHGAAQAREVDLVLDVPVGAHRVDPRGGRPRGQSREPGRQGRSRGRHPGTARRYAS